MIKVDSNVNQRRMRVLKRLEDQLKANSKPVKIDGKTTNKFTTLTDKDKERIEKQIEILKQRIVRA